MESEECEQDEWAKKNSPEGERVTGLNRGSNQSNLIGRN
jgi:hypothetical protein